MGVVGEAQIVLELDQDGVPEDQVQGEVQKEVLLHGIQKEEEGGSPGDRKSRLFCSDLYVWSHFADNLG